MKASLPQVIGMITTLAASSFAADGSRPAPDRTGSLAEEVEGFTSQVKRAVREGEALQQWLKGERAKNPDLFKENTPGDSEAKMDALRKDLKVRKGKMEQGEGGQAIDSIIIDATQRLAVFSDLDTIRLLVKLADGKFDTVLDTMLSRKNSKGELETFINACVAEKEDGLVLLSGFLNTAVGKPIYSSVVEGANSYLQSPESMGTADRNLLKSSREEGSLSAASILKILKIP